MWAGCYADSWQGLIVPDAFSHPAKVSRGLVHCLYRHLIEKGYVRKGDHCIDVFAGIGGTALDAIANGLQWTGVELEEKFVTLCQQNITLWRQKFGFSGATILQGDSRRLRAVIGEGQWAGVVGSPPYAEAITNGRSGIDKTKGKDPRDPKSQGARRLEELAEGYGTSPGQLGAMPTGDLILSSPPYAGAGEVLGTHNGIDYTKAKTGGKTRTPARIASGENYGMTSGNLGNLPTGDCLVSSPPYSGEGIGHKGFDKHPERSTHNSKLKRMVQYGGYGESPGQLGHEKNDTFWTAASTIMEECWAILKPQGVCVWVLKDYVSKGQIVPFCKQWRQLCEAHGFVLLEEIHASLVQDHGTQGFLFASPEQIACAINAGEYSHSATGLFLGERVRTERKSFFRRLAEKKGSPAINHETVFILRKAS